MDGNGANETRQRVQRVTERFDMLDLGAKERLPASMILNSLPDPASVVPGTPPNFGQQVLPHIFTISGRYGAQGRAYAWYDEATRDSRDNAERMRRDASIMECLEARQRGTALLNWHITPEDENSQTQVALSEEMTKILERTPQFLEFRRNLLEALWFGRYAVANAFGKRWIGGKMRTAVSRWEPRHGDKLVFRYEDGTARYDPEQIGIRIGSGYDPDPVSQFNYRAHRRHRIEATQYGLTYWLDGWERRTMVLHKHIIEDSPWEDSLRAGSIHGVGIRDRVYWTWYQMIECLQRAVEYLDRSSLGIEIWSYPAHNPTAEEATKKAATNQIGGGRSIVFVPRFPGEDADLYGVQHIEPGLQGVDVLISTIKEFFGAQIKRYILGQTLTSEAHATGLGSGVADAHMATYGDIVRYDAQKLQESISEDFLRPLQLENFPTSHDINLGFVIDTDSPDAESKLEAYTSAWNMGAKLKADDVLGVIGASSPEEDDDILQNPMLANGAGGMAGLVGGNGSPGLLNFHGDADDRDQDLQADEGTAAERPAGVPQQRPEQFASVRASDVAKPSEAQSEAGNYRKGHVRVHGLAISIETPKGRRRQPEWPPMAADYGYIRRHIDRDGDNVDVFLGPHHDSEIVYVLDQETKGGRFDEHKILMGFRTEKAAVQAYRDSYTRGWRVGPVSPMTIGQFKSWLDRGDQKNRAAPQVSKYSSPLSGDFPPEGEQSPGWQLTETARGTAPEDYAAGIYTGSPPARPGSAPPGGPLHQDGFPTTSAVPLDRLPGGAGDKLKPEDVDPDELQQGIRVEMEHTHDEQLALEIALDHLAEDPHYYSKLATIEKHSAAAGPSPAVKLPRRDARHGVGKRIGGNVYAHVKYLAQLPGHVHKAAKRVPRGFNPAVVKFADSPDGAVSFIQSKDFDKADEPTAGDSIRVTADGKVTGRKATGGQIYHHKWLMVADDYPGFDVDKAKQRSAQWMALKGVDKAKIGNRDYWDSVVTPKLQRYQARRHAPGEMEVANSTCRSGGAVGPNAKVPAVVAQVLAEKGPKATVLDFGAGRSAEHAKQLAGQGYNVTAHEYGANAQEGVHDPEALNHVYDVVYASNVLNVQETPQALKRTVLEIAESVKPGGILVANLPATPRKAGVPEGATGSQMVQDLLQELIGEVQIVEGGSSSPIWTVTKQSPEHYCAKRNAGSVYRSMIATLEKYGARTKKSSPGQRTFDWKEEDHPRGEAGKFVEKGTTTAPKRPAEEKSPEKGKKPEERPEPTSEETEEPDWQAMYDDYVELMEEFDQAPADFDNWLIHKRKELGIPEPEAEETPEPEAEPEPEPAGTRIPSDEPEPEPAPAPEPEAEPQPAADPTYVEFDEARQRLRELDPHNRVGFVPQFIERDEETWKELDDSNKQRYPKAIRKEIAKLEAAAKRSWGDLNTGIDMIHEHAEEVPEWFDEAMERQAAGLGAWEKYDNRGVFADMVLQAGYDAQREAKRREMDAMGESDAHKTMPKLAADVPAFTSPQQARDYIGNQFTLRPEDVTLERVNVKNLQSIAEGFNAVLGSTGVKIGEVSWTRRGTRALATYGHTAGKMVGKTGDIRFQRTATTRFNQDKEVKREEAYGRQLQRNRKERKERVAALQAEGKTAAADGLRRSKAFIVSQNATRWTFASAYPDRYLQAIAAHEAGHAVGFQMHIPEEETIGGQTTAAQDYFGRKLNQVYKTREEEWADAAKVSEYGSSDHHELWAECCAAHAIGKIEDVPEKIRAAFIETLKKARV